MLVLLTVNKKIKLYKAFILPHLEYCSPLFVGIGKGQRNHLEDDNLYFENINWAQQVSVIRRAAHYS